MDAARLLVVAIIVGIAHGFLANDHGDITRQALAQVAQYGYTFSLSASEEVAFAAMSVEGEAATLNYVGTDAWFYYDEKLYAGSQYLINLRNQFLDLMGSTGEEGPQSNDGAQGRKLLGKALNNLQNFYAHTSWVEMGKTAINTDLGYNSVSDPSSTYQPCPIASYVLTDASSLTSGYFFSGSCGTPPKGKCVAGSPPSGFGVSQCPDGLSKDSNSKPLYPQARALALSHSITFVKELLDNLAHDADHTDRALSAIFAQNNLDDGSSNSCLPWCAIFTTIPGGLIIIGIIAFVVWKKKGGEGGMFSNKAPKPRDIKNPLYT